MDSVHGDLLDGMRHNFLDYVRAYESAYVRAKQNKKKRNINERNDNIKYECRSDA